MNKSQAIFQEIENKLAKDDYASSLPAYHPAKGRRKRIVKEPEMVYKAKIDRNIAKNTTEDSTEIGNPKEIKSQDPFPGTSPEIEDPDESEIDPQRDFPDPGIGFPDEEEMPEEEPDPEIGDPDEEEFGR